MLEWISFFKLFQLGSAQGKLEFRDKKISFMNLRREALAYNDVEGYEEVVLQMIDEEELAMNK